MELYERVGLGVKLKGAFDARDSSLPSNKLVERR